MWVCKSGDDSNVLFLILIAVALFAGLGYAVTSSVSTAPVKVEDEKQKLDQAVLNNCEAAINLALLRLRNMGGCADDEINYELPDGSNANPNAPSDGHCNVFHPAYGGASPCGLTTDPSCDLTVLSIGDSCGGIVYAGESDGNRIYTTRADHARRITWNGGVSDPPWTDTGATSLSDGAGNTDILVALSDAGAPYQAAQICRTFGQEWYLPAYNELVLLESNKNLVGGFEETDVFPASYYWSSTEYEDSRSYYRRFYPVSMGYNWKTHTHNVRCVRQD